MWCALWVSLLRFPSTALFIGSRSPLPRDTCNTCMRDACRDVEKQLASQQIMEINTGKPAALVGESWACYVTTTSGDQISGWMTGAPKLIDEATRDAPVTCSAMLAATGRARHTVPPPARCRNEDGKSSLSRGSVSPTDLNGLSEMDYILRG